jgi:Rieske 2Fe-2S family protein
MTATTRLTPETADIATLLARRIRGRPLEGAFYAEPHIFDLDIAAVWARTWLFVASEAEIREPGDYVTVDIGPYSVIVVRDDEDKVHALLNVCRHRGTRILNERSGAVGNIVCGYHQWTYTPDGSLLHARDQPPTFDKSCFALKKVHLRVAAGLIFVCLGSEPPDDFDDVLARVTPYVLPHELHRTKVAAQVDFVEEANWKLVMENNRECYHCEAGHPELMRTFFPTYGYEADEIPKRLQAAHARLLEAQATLEAACAVRNLPHAVIEDLDTRVSGFRIEREALDGAGESYTLDGTAASRKLLGELDTARLGRVTLHTNPNGWFSFLADHAVTFSALPLAVDRTLVRATWLVHEDAVEGTDYEVDTLTHVWRKTNEQDAVFCARAHRGVTTPGYEPGPYSRSEYQVDAFVTWYVERMKEHTTA